jgi:hypothetical protein
MASDHGQSGGGGGVGHRRRSLVTEAVAATAVSGGTTVVVAALTVLAIGVVLDATWTATVGVAAGGALAVASWLCNREGPVATALGSLAVAVGVLAAAYALSRPVVDLDPRFVVGSVLFAGGALVTGLGAVATVPGALGSGQWTRTVFRAGVACVVPVVLLVVAAVEAVGQTDAAVDAIASALWEGFNVVVFPDGPNANVGGFLALASLAALAVAVALGTLPVVDLVPRSRREAFARRIATARTWLQRFALAGLPLAVLLTGVPREPLHSTLRDVGVEGLLRVVVDAHWLRAFLVAIAIVGFGASGVTSGVRWLARLDGRRVLRVIATTAPGGIVLVGAATVAPEYVLSRFRIGPADAFVTSGVDAVGASSLALAALVALVFATTTVLSAVTAAAAIGFIPDRTAAPSVAAGGVLLTAIAAALAPGDHAVIVFAAVVASVVVWDVGNYGVDVTAELAGTTSRIVEVLHAAGSVAVGAVLVVVALACLWASRSLAAGGGIDGPGLLGLAVIVLAVVVLTSTLQG